MATPRSTRHRRGFLIAFLAGIVTSLLATGHANRDRSTDRRAVWDPLTRPSRGCAGVDAARAWSARPRGCRTCLS
jgi:hypothetical protein